MRTTIEMSDDLLVRAKKKAAEDGVALKNLFETALREYLAGRPGRSGYRLKWKVTRGKLQPGVNLDDRDALFDLMDGRR